MEAPNTSLSKSRVEEINVPKKWKTDALLVDSLAGHLVETLPLFPRRFLQLDQVLRACEMPLSHIRILLLLQRNDLTISQLSRRLGIAKPNITPLVNALRDQHLVERQHRADDRRVVYVHLLPAGEEKLAQVRQNVNEQLASWPDCFSVSEIKEINEAAATLIRAADSMDAAEEL